MDSKLLITSKHSVGPIQGPPMSHAEAGEQWLRKYLKDKGRTEDQLAACLWVNNWTAVAEVSFWYPESRYIITKLLIW
jgi:tRNA ligase